MKGPKQPALNLTEVLSEPVDWRYKSFPITERAPSIQEVGSQGWNVLDGDFSLPALVLKESTLNHNIELMASYCSNHGVDLAPHAKTPVAPQIVQLQLAAGAWGISVANGHQARLFRRLGCRRMLMANEVVDRSTLGWIAGELDRDPGFEFASLVDSDAAVQLMDQCLSQSGSHRRLPVLIELGVPGGRCGCRTVEEALAVAGSVAASAHLQLAGVETYEAMISNPDLDTRTREIDALMAKVRALMSTLDARGFLAPARELIVTAGGSLFFDRIVAGLGDAWNLSRPVRVVLRSGSYVTHAVGEYEHVSPLDGRGAGELRLQQALELWAHVLSRPEPQLVVLGFGKRDVAHDHDLPVPFAVRSGSWSEPITPGDLTVFALNDQHARARINPELRLGPGDRVGFHVDHPCTTFDNWRLVPLVDDGYGVRAAIRCYL